MLHYKINNKNNKLSNVSKFFCGGIGVEAALSILDSALQPTTNMNWLNMNMFNIKALHTQATIWSCPLREGVVKIIITHSHHHHQDHQQQQPADCNYTQTHC